MSTNNQSRPRPCCLHGDTLSLGSIFSIPIRLHLSFFLLLGLQMVLSLLGAGNVYPMYLLFTVVVYGPILFLTILVHELGHAWAARNVLSGSSGDEAAVVEEIVLWPLGGYTVYGPVQEENEIQQGRGSALKGDLKIAFMGPFMHIPMGLIWWGIWVGLTTGTQKGLWPSWMIYLPTISSSVTGFFASVASEAFYLNLILLGFNLFIPAYPLDGGRIYAASLILYLKLQPLKAAKITAITAILISSGMVLYAFIGYFMSLGGSGLLLGVVGLFLLNNSYDLWKAAQNDELNLHPIFGRRCYQNTTGVGAGGAPASSGEAVEALPAQSEEAVMA